ncbi:MAG: HD domain-containing phosphohydrolase [Bacillota bacterium]
MSNMQKKDILFYGFIALVVFVGVLLGQLFIIPPGRAGIVWPALGLVFGFRYSLGRKVWPYLIGGYFLAYLFSECFIASNHLFVALLVASVMSVFLVIAVEIGLQCVRIVKYKQSVTLYSALKYGFVAFVIALFTSLSGPLFYVSIGIMSFDGFVSGVFVWFLGDFFSVVGFGLPVIYSIKYDKDGLHQNTLRSILVYGLFIIIIIGLLTDLVPFMNFRNHKYILAVFAFVLAFYLPYRTIYVFHIILLTTMIVFSPFDGVVNHLRLMMEVNLFLSLMSVTTITIKYHMHAVNENKEMISVKAKRLDLLLNALDNLLTLPSESNKLERHNINDHLKQMFHMVFTLFDKADYASCMIIDDTILFIDGVGYDIDVLNALHLTGKAKTTYHLDEPYIQTQAETFIKKDLGDQNYAVYKRSNPAIKESIYVGFQVAKDIVCEMSFDLKANSKYTYTDNDVTFFNSLQTLFSSFYETEKVTREYSTLKNDIILSLLRTLELFDKQAGIHSMDVALIAQALAEKLEMHEGMVNDIYWAGIVHDIGKLGIDVKVLKKQGFYTVSDYEVMQEHALLSYQILSKSDELTAIANIVKHHHEWVDGSGYPDQLVGNEIPLSAKILHIAEAVGVMMRDWSYQNAKSDQMIIDVLIKQKDTQFDRKCVDAMIELILDGVLDDVRKANRAD